MTRLIRHFHLFPLQIRFVSNYFFDVGLYFPKLSMLTIYFQLLPCQIRPLCWALYFTAVFTVLSFFITLFDVTFWCGSDPSVNWCAPNLAPLEDEILQGHLLAGREISAY